MGWLRTTHPSKSACQDWGQISKSAYKFIRAIIFFLLPLIITDNRLFVLSKSIVSCMETSVMTTVYTDYSQRILTVFICFIVSKLMTWQCTVCRTSVYLCIVYHIHSKFIKLFNGSWKSSLFVTVSWSGPKNDQAKSTQLKTTLCDAYYRSLKIYLHSQGLHISKYRS